MEEGEECGGDCGGNHSEDERPFVFQVYAIHGGFRDAQHSGERCGPGNRFHLLILHSQERTECRPALRKVRGQCADQQSGDTGFRNLLNLERAEGIVHSHHRQEGTGAAQKRRCHKAANIVEPVHELRDISTRIRANRPKNNQFHGNHNHEDNHGCQQDFQEVGDQTVNLLVNQAQHPDGQDDGNDCGLVVDQQDGQAQKTHGCDACFRRCRRSVHNGGIHIGGGKSKGNVFTDFEFPRRADRKEEREEVENQVANHVQYDHESAVSREKRHASQRLQVRNQRNNRLEHTTANQNRKRRGKDTRDSFNHCPNLILLRLLYCRASFGDVYLRGHLIEHSVDLSADDNLKLSAFHLRSQNTVKTFQLVDVCFAVVLQIEPKPGCTVGQDRDIVLSSNVGDDFRRQFLIGHAPSPILPPLHPGLTAVAFWMRKG